MALITKSCVLKAMNNTSKLVKLPHNEVVFLGRNETTMVTDSALSRKQVSARADYNQQLVEIETLGMNFSGCNGYALCKNGKYVLKHGDLLELRIGVHAYEVLFDDNTDEAEEPKPKKRKKEYPIFSTAKRNLSINEEFISKGTWETLDNHTLLIYTHAEVRAQKRIAAFDMDGTLIKTKSGSRFPKTSEDWVINFPDIKPKLNKLLEENYKLVIFTNQAALKSDQVRNKEFKFKIESIFKSLGVPFQLFAATTRNVYRKPIPGMFDVLCNIKNEGVKINISESIYVGDAAGREKNWAPKKNKDHSIADRLFALNIGFKFYTPEEYFLGARSVPFLMPKFDPRSVSFPKFEEPALSKKREVIIMVGSPGSGKSHYCREHLIKNGYVYANRDVLGSWQACVKLLEVSIKDKQNVVIDNTNGDKVSRKRYIDAAKKLNVPLRCFLMTASFECCKHNNKFRELIDKSHIIVGDAVLNVYKKHYEEPTLDEGFDGIIKIPFMPHFTNPDHEKLYKMFLLES